MGKARAEIDIERPADEVWAVVGAFGGIASWMPGIESCVVDGDDRVIKTMGMEVTERLERREIAVEVAAKAQRIAQAREFDREVSQCTEVLPSSALIERP